MDGKIEYLKDKGLPPEWFSGLEVLPALEVKKLPVGARVMIVGADRRGRKSTLDCSVTQSGKVKVLAYRDEWGIRVTKKIAELPRKVFAVKG